jgi:hypothetical protein
VQIPFNTAINQQSITMAKEMTAKNIQFGSIIIHCESDPNKECGEFA